jgi:CBS domain-containing protein
MMTPNPAVIGPQERFAAAEERMRERKINSLIVTEGDGRIVGVLQIYDIADEKAVG